MARVLAIANQKGGVAKTTTVAALGAALRQLDRRVLLVDLDAQACLTFALGVDTDRIAATVADVLLTGMDPAAVTVTTAEGMDLLPADESLAGVDAALLHRSNRDHVLGRALQGLRVAYDDIIIDCSPSLGLLTLNALAAADELIIPMTAEMLGHRAVGQILDTAADVRELLNPRLRVLGVLPTMVDARTAHARDIISDVATRYGVPLLPVIPRSVRVGEAPARGRSVLAASPRTKVAAAYRELAAVLTGDAAV